MIPELGHPDAQNHLRPTWFQFPEHRTQGRAHDASTNKCDIDGINRLACILSGDTDITSSSSNKSYKFKGAHTARISITIRLRVPKSRFSLGSTMNSDSLCLCLWNNYTIGGPIFWEKTLKLLHSLGQRSRRFRDVQAGSLSARTDSRPSGATGFME